MRAIIENRVVKSAVQDLHIPEVDVGTFIREAWEKFPERTAIIDDSTGKCYTYAELQELSTRIAANLWARGFRVGDVAGLHCDVNPQMIFAFFGVVFAGGSVVFAKPELTQREVEYHFRGTRPSIAFCDEENAKKTRAACETISSVKTLVVFGDHEGFVPMDLLLQKYLGKFDPPRVDNLDATAAVLYSSGTSGLSKPVKISHGNIVAQCLISTAGDGYIERNGVALGNVPFTHISGVWLFCAAFSVGAAIVLIASSGVNDILSAIEKYKVSVMFLFPTHALKILHSDILQRYNVSSLKQVLTGGSHLSSIVIEEIVAKMGIVSFRKVYGLTEVTGPCTTASKNPREYVSAGMPVAMMHVKVVDISTHKKMDAGEQGEICIKGPLCSPGYIHYSGTDTRAEELYDADGFLRTGDIGYYDEDGCLFIVDRLKQMIKCMDKQVAPAELENILIKHPDVKEVVVVGVPHIEYGEAARAFVVLSDHDLDGKMTEMELRKLVEDECALYKHLHGGVEFRRSLPKSDNGKYLRRALKDEIVGSCMP